MSNPLVRIGITTGTKGQSEESNLETGACVPREFKGEAGRTQPQGRRSMVGKSLQARDIHLEKAGELRASLYPGQIPVKGSFSQLCLLIWTAQFLRQADDPSGQGKVQMNVEKIGRAHV